MSIDTAKIGLAIDIYYFLICQIAAFIVTACHGKNNKHISCLRQLPCKNYVKRISKAEK